jgi:uncharacterized protein YoxC
VEDLTTTNVLLVVVALMAVLQAVAATVAVVAVTRTYRRLVARVDHIERDLTPIASRALVILDRMDRITQRVDEGTEKLDTALAATTRGATIALGLVNGRVKRTAALVTGIVRGFKAARDTWRARSARAPLRLVERPIVLPQHANSASNVARLEAGPTVGG